MSRLHASEPVVWVRPQRGGQTARTFGMVAARRGGRAWVAFLCADGSQILRWCPIAQLERLRLRSELPAHGKEQS